MITEPKVTIDLLNTTAQGQITWVASHKKDFSNLNLLNISGKDSPDFLSLGLNQSVLDETLSDTVKNVSYMSSTLSDSDCSYSDIYVEGTFFSSQSFYTTSINFGANYPKKVRIDYYNNDDLIDTETIDEIDSEIIYSQKSIINCTKLRMTFLEAWAPYRSAYLQEWLIGALIVFNSKKILSLNLLEDTDPISRNLIIDKAMIEALPVIKQFDITDPNGVYRFLAPGTKVEIEVKLINEEEQQQNNIYLGTYFVKSIESDDNKILKIDCESYLGKLENYKFYGSLIYNGDLSTSSAKKIIKSIFDYCGISDYEIDDDLDYIPCQGYIPVKSCRDALRDICFVNDITIFDNRSTNVRAKKRVDPSDIDQKIISGYITTPPKYKIKDKVKSVSTTTRLFSTGTTVDLVNDISHMGMYEFRVPATNPTITRVSGTGTAILTDASATSAKVTIFGSGTFKITGTEYKESYKNNYTFESGNSGDVVNIEDCKLINIFNGQSICQRTSEYYNNNNIKLNIEYICTGQETGLNTEIDILGKKFIGIITHQSLDVAGGMIANAEILGAVV